LLSTGAFTEIVDLAGGKLLTFVGGSPYSVAPLSSNAVVFAFSPISETLITNTVTFQSNGGNTNVVLIGK